ncbi:MAG TPA: PAS domain-containing protein [Pirellulaceae bacterium]|nr:PAS domain-containing protein [Pirellulaceae bacterium]
MAKQQTSSQSTEAKTLRQRAEMLLHAKSAVMPTMPTADVQALVYELNVYQIELEIQNEELRQSQLELADSRDRFSDLYDFAPVSYVTLDKDGRILEANLTAATFLDVERKSLIGANLSTWIDNDAQDDFFLHRKSVFSGNARQICDVNMHKSDGTPMVVRLESIAQEAELQRQSRTALIDVTQQQAAQSALRDLTDTLEQRVAEQTHEVQLLAAAVSHLAEGIVITDDELDWPGPRIRFVNEAMCRITGYTADELIGQSPRVLQGEQTDRRTLSHMKRELAAGRPVLCELINYRKDSTPYAAELYITPLFNSKGHRTNFVSIHRDITERKKLQREVLGIAENEQRRIGQDLHDSVQQELAGLGMLAETLLENLSRTTDKSDDPQASRLRELAIKVVNGIARTHQDVHAIARGLVPVRIDTQGLMDALRELALRTEELAGVTCAFKCEQPVEISDNSTSTHLFRIAQESITNALKHGQPEHILIALESDNGQPILQVADDGTGFDVTEQTRGLGLKTMLYRASLIGASLKVSPVETGGTLVTCRVFLGGGGNLR